MAGEKLVQNNFVNGQYDREVQSKERTDFVGSGVAKALNVVSSEKGELRKRLGTRYLKTLNGSAVIVPFRLPTGDDVLLVCSDGNVKGYQFVGNELQEYLVHIGVAPTFPTTSWSTDTNGDYTVALDATTYTGFNYANYPYYNKGCAYQIPHSTTNTTTIVEISSTNAQLLSSLRFRWCLTCNGNHTGHYKGYINPVLQYSDDNVNWVSVETDVVNCFSGSDKTTYYGYHHYGTGSNEKTENYVVSEVRNVNHLEAHKHWRLYFLKSIYNNQVYSGEKLELFISNVEYVSTTTTAFDVNDSFFDAELLTKIKYSQHYDKMVLACEGKDPIQIDYSASGLALTSFSGLPVGYEKPSSVQFFQQRLWFGGFNAAPTTVLASKIDDYDNFTEQNPLQFDDYLNLKCNQLREKITNITGGQKVLYTYSEDGLALVDSGSGGMIATNQSIEFNLRNRMPAGSSTPAFKDDVMLYASSDGTKLYAVDYDLMTERFQVDDLAKYAKDITFAKITELHYVNDESKLIYGLLENGNMFALNYGKGVYQGFFPFAIQDGYVYDIVQIKVGRNYKLLIVASRSGNWYIEEMADKGVYADTIAPMMTKEDKKWATYDNINNNIALDCYQNYANTIELTATLDYENGTLTTTTDLTSFIGEQIMLGQVNDDKEWVVLTIDSTDLVNVYNITIDSQRGNADVFDILYKSTTQLPVAVPAGTQIGVVAQGQYLGEFDASDVGILSSLYAWVNGNDTVYTNGSAPAVSDQLYDQDGNEITAYYQNTVAAYDSVNDEITVNESIQQSTTQDLYCWGDVYTLSATPSVNDQLYNADGTPVIDYLYNTVYSVSGDTITTITSETSYSATYAWAYDNTNIYTYTNSVSRGDVVELTNGYTATAQGGVYTLESFAFNGGVYTRTDTVANNRRAYSNGGTTYWVPVGMADNLTTTSTYVQRIYTSSTGSSGVDSHSSVPTYSYEDIYLVYNGNDYARNSADDVPAGVTVTTTSFTRDATGDIQGQTTYTITTKVFARSSADDLIKDSVIVELPKAVFKASYGALYDAYAFIKITRPYESMKTVQQINLEVQNTMHLSVGTALDYMQVLEDINDNTHYDLTNMTMNGGYVIVPEDTAEWEKYIILKSDKGLPFTINAVEVIMNYSNEGGN